jgi:hypothetical protein
MTSTNSDQNGHEKVKRERHDMTMEIIKHITELQEKGTIKVETVSWDKTASEEERRAIDRAGFLFGDFSWPLPIS